MADDHSSDTLTLDSPAIPEPPQTLSEHDQRFFVLGVQITNVTRPRAVDLIEEMIRAARTRTRSVFFVNAHTLNLAAADRSFRRVLDAADCIFGDGTGVRWAARLQGIRVRDNLVGTDLTPRLFQSTAGRGYRYFLLGGDRETIRRAAAYAEEHFPGWTRAGFHHGYLTDAASQAEAVRRINRARPDVLLVGMGNPTQERWIDAHRDELQVPVCMAVGGLFGYWAGDLRRSPAWLRRWGAEWLGILVQQPHKARRYLLGNPLFLYRILREWLVTRRRKHRRKCRRKRRQTPRYHTPDPDDLPEPTPAGIRQSRWYLKKAARKGLAAAAWTSGSLALARSLAAGPRVRVLTYHRFGDSPYDPFCVARDDFDAQMRWLADRGLAVSLADIEGFLAGERSLADGSVLVTVDDGSGSVHSRMLPVLKHYGIPAVAYLTPSLIRESRRSAAPAGSPVAEADEHLTWDEVEELAAGGMVIGSHGWTHRSLGRMGPAEVRDEAVRSREVLESRLGRRVTSIAYPFGTRADYSRMTGNVLAETGYTTAFTSQHGAIVPGADPIELPRVKVEGGEGLWMFRLLCRGALDGWRLVDRALWRVQHSGG